MTSLLEKMLAFIAPYRCIICSNYNNIVCDDCVFLLPKLEETRCVLCGGMAQAHGMCTACTKDSPLAGVFVAGEYGGTLQKVIHHFKFEHARAAYEPLATFLMDALPSFDDSWLVTAVPTSSSHIRARGYDHARLLARWVAGQSRVKYATSLIRLHDVQQVGSGRKDRQRQAGGAFALHAKARVRGKKVLIVDDVCTTGATLSAAAGVLRTAGAREVWGAVVAWQAPKG